MQDLLGEINSITLDHDKGNYLPEPGGDQGSCPTGSSLGHTPHTTLWNSSDMGAITGFVIDSEDLASLLSSCSDGGLGRGSYNKEELAHSPWTGEYDHESSPGLFTSPKPSYLEEAPPDVPLLEESLPPLSKGEPCAPTHTPDDNSNIENFNYHYNIVPGMNNDDDVDEGNVDADPPKGSVYDPISEGEATTPHRGRL